MTIESIAVEPSLAGTAIPVATDRIGGNDYQIVKLAIGADGTATLIDSAGMPISAASLPLPSGASTEVTLALAKGVLDAVLTASQAIKTAAEALNSKTTVVNTADIVGAVVAAISNWPATQPVSGTFWQATQPVSAAALPLPAGAATEATVLSTTKQKNSASSVTDYGQVMLAQRRDSDTAETTGDGQYTALKQDEAGRLKVATQPGSCTVITGNITANAQTVFADVRRVSNVMLHMVAASLVGHNVTFEGSIDSTNGTDGNWFGIQVIRSNANTIELTTGVLAATPAYGWEASVNGMAFVRVRATAHTSGTATWKFLPGTYATEPIPGAQVSGTQPVSGTITATLAAATVRAGFVAGAGIWYDDSATTLSASATFTGTSRDLTVAASAAAFANAATYAKELRVSAESDVTGTLWLEVSRDNTNWRRVKSLPTSAVTGGGFYAEIIHRPSWRYARVGFTNGAGAQARFSIGSIAVVL